MLPALFCLISAIPNDVFFGVLGMLVAPHSQGFVELLRVSKSWYSLMDNWQPEEFSPMFALFDAERHRQIMVGKNPVGKKLQ